MVVPKHSPRLKHCTALSAGAVLAVMLVVTSSGSVLAQTATQGAIQQPGAQRTIEAGQALQRGDFDQAVVLYNNALDDTSIPNDRRAVLLTERGVAQMKRRSFRAALDDFNRAASLYPEYAAAYVNRGSLLLMMGNSAELVREAIKDFDRAIVLAPTQAAAFGNRGAAYLKLGAFDAAIADFTQAIEQHPQNPAALNGRGRARLLAGRSHGALRDFSRAITINPGFVQSYRNRAETQSRAGAYKEAAEDLSRALAFDARRIEDYLARGQAYLAAGNASAALTDFQRVVEIDPKSVEGHIGTGYAKAHGESFDEALNDLAQAIEIDPRSARAYAVRAWVHKRRQQPELGEKDVERALRLEPVKADAFWAQGEMKEATGDQNGAVAAYSRALGQDLRHAEALAALSRLGFQPQLEETLLSANGRDGWTVTMLGDQFIAAHPQFPSLKATLEMLGAGQPKIISFERQKAPYADFGLLQFTAGSLQGSPAGEMVEAMAVLDLTNSTVIGMPITKLGSKAATFAWSENRVTVNGADGLSETFSLRMKSEPKEPVREVASTSAPKRNETGPNNTPRPQGSSPGTPAWAPWNQGGGPAREASARPPPKKSKTLFDLLFGN